MANAGETVFAHFTKVLSIHRGFYKWKMEDDNKNSEYMVSCHRIITKNYKNPRLYAFMAVNKYIYI